MLLPGSQVLSTGKGQRPEVPTKMTSSQKDSKRKLFTALRNFGLLLKNIYIFGVFIEENWKSLG